MFSNKKMENKSFVTVRNNSAVPRHGVSPGETGQIITDEKGRAMTPELDKALRSAKKGGALEIIKPKAKAKAKSPKVSKSTSRGQ